MEVSTMVNSKTLLKNRVFGISLELDELLKLYSSREGVSLSQLIRTSLEEKIDKLMIEEEKFWQEISKDKLAEILNSLTDYLNSKFSGDESLICEHSSIWENNYDENFTHTKEFCIDLQIELNAFLKRIESDFEATFDCECRLYEILMDRRNNNGK